MGKQYLVQNGMVQGIRSISEEFGQPGVALVHYEATSRPPQNSDGLYEFRKDPPYDSVQSDGHVIRVRPHGRLYPVDA